MKYISNLKKRSEKIAVVACASGAVWVSASCVSRSAGVADDSSARQETLFHADNDIAMTVRSLVDAVRVGEILLPADYDFVGVLTDGQGTPLYTDVEGAPGEWQVKVYADDGVSISNLYMGDLMDEDLRSYILSALHLNSADLVSAYHNPDNDDELIWHYDAGEVDINFSTVPASTPSGLEGTIMSISISRRSL